MRLPGPGPSDFRQLREEGRFYVDKTAWIAELLLRPEQVVLLPRPRRFGKTLNLSALRYFLEASEEDRRPLFDGLTIASAGPDVLEHQARHPVVSLTLEDIGLPDFEGCVEALQGRIAEAYAAHRSLLDGPTLSPEDRAAFERFLHGTASRTELRTSLQRDVLSVHDTGTGPTAPERVYHAFVLGMLAHLEPEYRVRSERESGYGRSDVLIIPTKPGQPGAVLELKRVLEDQGESPEDALGSALQQIEARDYAAELRASGADPVRKVAIAFAGKRVWVRCA